MAQVNLYEAKTRLSELIRQALSGEQVIIARHGKPVVRLVPYRDSGSVTPGFLRGKAQWSEDFDAPLDDLAEYM